MFGVAMVMERFDATEYNQTCRFIVSARLLILFILFVRCVCYGRYEDQKCKFCCKVHMNKLGSSGN